MPTPCQSMHPMHIHRHPNQSAPGNELKVFLPACRVNLLVIKPWHPPPKRKPREGANLYFQNCNIYPSHTKPVSISGFVFNCNCNSTNFFPMMILPQAITTGITTVQTRLLKPCISRFVGGSNLCTFTASVYHRLMGFRRTWTNHHRCRATVCRTWKRRSTQWPLKFELKY